MSGSVCMSVGLSARISYRPHVCTAKCFATCHLTVSCFSKIQIGFTFLVPADLGSPGKRAVKRVCVCDVVVYWPVTRPSRPLSTACQSTVIGR